MSELFLATLIALLLHIVPANAREGAERAAFSPDGSHLLIGWSDGIVTQTDVATGVSTILGNLGDSAPIKALVFSDDGARLAILSTKTIRVIESDSGKDILQMEVSKDEGFLRVEFSKDASELFLASGLFGDKSLLLAVDEVRKTQSFPKSNDDFPAFLGQHIAIYPLGFGNGPSGVTLFDRTGGQKKIEANVYSAYVPTYDQNLLIIGGPVGIELFDLSDGHRAKVLDPPRRHTSGLAGGVGDQVVAFDKEGWRTFDSRLFAWDGDEHRDLNGPISKMELIGDQRAVVQYEDGRVAVADLSTGATSFLQLRGKPDSLLSSNAAGAMVAIRLEGGVVAVADLNSGERQRACIARQGDERRCDIAAALGDALRPDAGANSLRAAVAAIQLAGAEDLDPRNDGYQYGLLVERLVAMDELQDAHEAYSWLSQTRDVGLRQSARLGLAKVLALQRRWEDARSILEPLVAELATNEGGKDRSDCIYCDALSALAGVQFAQGKAQEAEKNAALSVDFAGELTLFNSRKYVGYLALHAQILEAAGQWERAAIVRQRVLNAFQEQEIGRFDILSDTKIAVGEALAARGQAAQGDATAQEAVDDIVRAVGDNHRLSLSVRERLGRLRIRSGHPVEALVPLRAAAASLRARGPAESARLDPFRGVFRAELAASYNAYHLDTASRPAAPRNAVPRPPVVSARHAASISFVAFSPDGQFIVSTDEQGVVVLQAAASEEGVWRTKSGGLIAGVSFSADSSAVAIVRESGEAVVAQAVDGGPASSDAVEPFVVPSLDGYLSFAEGATTLTKLDTTFSTYVAAFPATGRIAYAAENEVCIIATTENSREPLCKIVSDSSVRALFFSDDGSELIAITLDGSLVTASSLDLKVIRKISLDENSIWAGAISTDRKFVALGFTDGDVAVANIDTGDVRLKDRRHAARVEALAFSPDGTRLVSGAADGSIVVASATGTAGELDAPELRVGHQLAVTSVAVAPDGTIATASEDGTLRLWDAMSGLQVKSIPIRGEVKSLNVTADGYFVAVGNDTILVDARSRRMVKTVSGTRKASLSGNGVFAIYNYDGNIDVIDGSGRGLLSVRDAKVDEMHLSRNGKMLAVLYGGDLQLWSIDDHKIIETISDADTAHFSSNHLFANGFGGISVIDLETKSVKVATRSEDQGHCSSGRFVGENELLLWSSAEVCSVQRSGKSKAIFSLFTEQAEQEELEGQIASVAINSAESDFAVGMDNGTIALFDIQSGAFKGKLTGRDSGVRSLAFSPDGRFLVSGHDDANAIVWDLASRSTALILGE